MRAKLQVKLIIASLIGVYGVAVLLDQAGKRTNYMAVAATHWRRSKLEMEEVQESQEVTGTVSQCHLSRGLDLLNTIVIQVCYPVSE